MSDGPRVRRSTTTKIEFGHGTTAAHLREALDGVPDEATVSVTHYEGNQREPTQTTMTFTWNLPRRSET